MLNDFSRPINNRLVSFLTAVLVISFIVTPIRADASTVDRSTPTISYNDPDPNPYRIFPSNGVQGKEYEVTVTSKECQNDPTKNSLKDFELAAPWGSGITITNSKSFGCSLTARLAIAGDAPVSIAKLRLVTNGALARLLDFAINSITRGPIPPGLNGEGQVDVMWSVMPDKITSDNFGAKVKRQFYCVEVQIGNNSGF